MVCSSSGQAPIGAMQAEHVEVDEIIRSLKALTNDYTPPEDACGTYRSLYVGLQAM